MRKILVLVLFVTAFLAGCGTMISPPTLTISKTALGQGYYPIPEIREDARHTSGKLAGYSVHANGMSVGQAASLDKRMEELRGKCVLGVKNERKQVSQRINPHLSSTTKSFAAIGAGIPEQIVLVDASYSFDCEQPLKQVEERKRRW